ncbi:MAG: hypothetical protein E7292_09675 [Lachnospiraceae bacterium]|nr:hypothetical protein [Lachnospiraceae bacterium]
MKKLEKINFKTSVANIWLGMFLLIVSVLFECVAIWGFREDGRDGIIAMVLLTIFLNLPLAAVGIMAIHSYFAASKKMSYKLREYGEDKILANIESHTLYTYSGFFGDKTYFTDKLIVDPKTAIIDYNEISYMYLRVSSSKTGCVHSLGLELWDGTQMIICNGVKNAQIMQMMQLCFQHNSQIMCGRTKENDATQKKRVADFKNGNKRIPCLRLDDDITTPVSQELVQMQEVSILPTAMSPSAAQEYVAKNFLPTENIKAINFYREATGVGLAEAKSVVDRIFANRQSEGKVLRTPYEWTPEAEKKANAQAKKVGGIIIMIIAVVLYVMMTAGTCIISYFYPMTLQDILAFIVALIGHLVVFGGLFVIGLWLFKRGKADTQ